MTSNRSVSSSVSSAAPSNIISQIAPVTSTNIPTDNSQNISYLLIQIRDERTSEHLLPSIEQKIASKLTTSIRKNSIPLTDTHQQQQTVINTPIYELHLNLLKNNEKKQDTYSSYKKFHQRKRNFSKLENDDKHQFNNATYCFAYCTIIIIGVTIGGWMGGLFEFISNGYNGCINEYRGTLKCQIKYASFNVTTHCINIFYKKTLPNHSPYICLCRFRNNIKSKYRDCEFLYAKIQ